MTIYTIFIISTDYGTIIITITISDGDGDVNGDGDGGDGGTVMGADD